MEWVNEPASWQRTGDVLTVNVDSGTDFWRETGYGYIRDSGHVYGEVLGGDLDISVRVRCTLGVQYDQAGVLLRADGRALVKNGGGEFPGRVPPGTPLALRPARSVGSRPPPRTAHGAPPRCPPPGPPVG